MNHNGINDKDFSTAWRMVLQEVKILTDIQNIGLRNLINYIIKLRNIII